MGGLAVLYEPGHQLLVGGFLHLSEVCTHGLVGPTKDADGHFIPSILENKPYLPKLKFFFFFNPLYLNSRNFKLCVELLWLMACC